MTGVHDDVKKLLDSLIGRWQGESKTWFEPGILADQSVTESTFEPILGGGFLRHRYCSFIRGEAREGEELIGINQVTGDIQVTWIDSFHMKSAIMFSQGKGDASRFSVVGTYDVGEGHSPWGWKTVWEKPAGKDLLITAFNVSPDGEEAKAIETCLCRV